jgi:pilus assembly protein CpaE
VSSLGQAKIELPADWDAVPASQRAYRAARSESNVATNPSLSSSSSFPNPIGVEDLSIAVISPSEEHRLETMQAMNGCAGAYVSEFASYQAGVGDLPATLVEDYDVIIIDLDGDAESALDLVESIGANGVATVMVFSESSDPELLVRCMRAGAREFLTLPFSQDVMVEALVRSAARRPATRPAKKPAGKLYAFLGSKGGAGTTMLASNFAVALAMESGEKTLLIDLDLPLGDAALNLGITAEFSAIDALQQVDRLDGKFLEQLLAKHSSGLWVLAAPGRFVSYQSNNEGIDRLLHVARHEFENVVVDMGSRLEMMGTTAYKEATTMYLVTQASIPELRNANRLITQFFSAQMPKLEVVINRFESRVLGVSEEHITKALTRAAHWKIPNDYAAVKTMQINAKPLVLTDSAISRQVRLMVGSVTGKSETPAKKKKAFSLNIFG